MAQEQKPLQPPQHQDRRPGLESEMKPRPAADDPKQQGCDRLQGQVALITGGDSGIGRAVAIAFAKEGADIAIVYLNEHDDARDTAAEIEKLERRCLTIAANLTDPKACRACVDKAVREFSRLDVVVNNAATQVEQE